MDDISFFESLPYAHRGGIWADACRIKRTTLSTLQPLIPSAPNPDLQGTPSTSSQNGAIPTEGVAAIEAPEYQSPTPAETRSSKEGSVMELSANDTATRRRSCFSGPVADDAPVLMDQPLDSSDDQIVANEDTRGRTSHPKAMSTSSRSSSSKGGMTDVNSSDLGQDTEDSAQSQLFPSPSRRSSSRQSQRDVQSGNDSEEPTKSISGRSTPIPRRTSDAASTISSSPPASSFLSTLRTRDRQALKESAKEMARKIRVNWGLGKDWNMITTSKEPATDNSRATQDGSSSLIHANYADVRAAVAERKEKEKTASRDATEATVPGAAGSEVPDIPETSANKDAIVSSSLSLPSSPPDNTLRRSLSRGRTITEINDAPVESPHTPILVQPQGKTMTIPGIHASHRGEVMALGYVPPPMTMTDKNKNNSFYRRLLKGESSQDPVDSVSGVSGADEDIGSSTLGPTTTGATSQARPMPPPLPPRSSTPNPATNPSMGAPFLASKGDDSFPQGEHSELSSPESSKEEHKDLSVPEAHVSPVITSLTSTTPTPPPLPPRRIQTTA